MTLKILPPSEGLGAVAYREQGQGDPLVLIHGVGMQSAAWWPQMDDLARTHRVIALDMPGHGASDPLARGSTLADFVTWLHRVLNRLGLRRVSLAGHSMGALIAGGFAVSHPEMVARVALLNGVFRRDREMRAAVEARAKVIDEGDFDTITPLRRWFGDGQANADACAQVEGWLRSVDPSAYATAYAAFASGDATYADEFSDIACPLLALTGQDDPNSTPAMSRAMAEVAPKGRAAVIEGHRHMVNLTAADVVNREMRDWLATKDELEGTS
ncbi:alpha/beta hydrolase [Sulfitobacter pseudonitzschiae]|uniref:Alpha/beta hydrolase n=1 Tax=Pseudosulfitobacter pseudonitzschiae TaxID=1402135 RepID=A0A9Q2RZR4_9RHOB|nr:alpha/beta hydrolase [Pseudosulfitobacter pseudonitzschiae]MBM2291788.1 alpha/beta hydrolase [Pseudosulfitobacter pseudonitzschiae]MBM2296706.1 alpha/beta hydrolase [Pseudosulfitobacter pseudonitzschiae]MBM2301619.1 alpha/beta hydrolase [Pseudosulfitobacter pseudonitzschiae]MBM2311402.1 alpha/beta hydrolase [Pseudosulfitobacter pseudonitzschiae]MBM2316316.1 alpha/beta hydrolase [Pseudosulfitobacter pseudonitzschiae]